MPLDDNVPGDTGIALSVCFSLDEMPTTFLLAYLFRSQSQLHQETSHLFFHGAVSFFVSDLVLL